MPTLMDSEEVVALLADFKQELITFCNSDQKIYEENWCRYILPELNRYNDIEFCGSILHSYIDYVPNSKFKTIMEYGGPESNTIESCIIFSYNDRVVKMCFSYFSHEGYNFDRVTFYYVTPVNVTKIIFV